MLEGEQLNAVIESSVAAAGWVQHAMVVATVEAEVEGEVKVGSYSDDESTAYIQHARSGQQSN